MAKKTSSSRTNKPARGKDGKFTISGPALQAGSLDSSVAQETSELNTVTTQEVSPMSKNTPTTPAVSTEGSVDFKALAAKGFTALNTRVSDVTPTYMLDKLPEGVKTVAGKTPVSVIVGLVAYGLYRKFFKKTPNTNA